jgi:hypothetical protein
MLITRMPTGSPSSWPEDPFPHLHLILVHLQQTIGKQNPLSSTKTMNYLNKYTLTKNDQDLHTENDRTLLRERRVNHLLSVKESWPHTILTGKRQ